MIGRKGRFKRKFVREEKQSSRVYRAEDGMKERRKGRNEGFEAEGES